MMIPKIDQEQRAQVVREYERLGCDSVSAALIVDLACQAAEEAMGTLWRKAMLAPDATAFHSTYDLALQMVVAGASAMLQQIAARDEADGVERGGVAVQGSMELKR